MTQVTQKDTESDRKRTSKFFIKEIRRATWTDHSFREDVCAIHFFVLLQAMPHFVNRQQSCEGYAPSIKVLEEKRPQRGWEAEIDRLKDWKIKTSETAETSDTNKHQKTCCSFVTLICCSEVTIKRPRRNESYNWRPGLMWEDGCWLLHSKWNMKCYANVCGNWNLLKPRNYCELLWDDPRLALRLPGFHGRRVSERLHLIDLDGDSTRQLDSLRLLIWKISFCNFTA